MAYRVAINGFGRIGRLAFRVMFKNKDFEIVAVNDLTDAETLAHLLKYDSIHRTLPYHVEAKDGFIIVDGHKVKALAERDPTKLPWKEHAIDLVIESTGLYTSKEKAAVHLASGAKKVLISAPASGDLKTVVYNVNHKILTPQDTVISAGSCTTNALAPVVKVLSDKFGVERGFMNTIHAYTNDQRLQDAPHKDMRRARAAAVSIIPSSTGAASALGKVIPEVKGLLDGVSMRVPTICGSIVDFTVELKAAPTIEDINAAMKSAESESFHYNTDQIVSADVIGDDHGSIFDATQTMVVSAGGKNMYKVFAWYDNEMSYTHQLIRIASYFAKLS